MENFMLKKIIKHPYILGGIAAFLFLHFKEET